ncbi:MULTISPECIES: Na+/H+ antiporter [Bifidobacterium]|uniref:Na+/H+ antiporter n=3 Tax=Bifidobacterium TaxID=1678 RepID=A0A7J5TLY5_BIFBI|nr:MULTISPECIES: Na+/H+ antiporter [Bifidobacterium]MCB8547055.1 Na+/H+ antiporter [Bifidobacterium sp. MSK23_125]MCB8553797.1 Na+/H+ antiporter [Bifidobacterium sp. MSK23_139]HJI96311.1 Na+/H+ antiporter [Bifidobacteriaceae bacterium]ACL29808.1 probable NhaP-type Na(+)/H(+) exchanger [Bifidobacterium animalis subsp. lactis AD011]ACS46938.1 NhaP-type Na(+)/H(+) exchanger [Bifidobacterium animalis subsp. lactis Bl-04]
MSVLILILCILGAVLLSSFLSRFLPRISTPLVQIVLGLIASQMPFFPDVQLDPELFLVLFIAPLLYLEAHEINKSQLLKSLKLSLSLAIGLAIFTMVVVGFSLHTLWPMFPLAAALALGAALGPTDAVAVSSLSHEATLTQRQIGVLKGESLFNDASGIVGFQFAIAAAVTGQFRVGEAAWEFLITFFGGAVFGCIVGVLANWVFESSRQLGWETTTTRILMELFLPFLLYLGAEAVHVSGILSVVAAGLVIRFDRTGIGPNVARTNIVASSVWSVLSFSLNGAVFILLGMLLPGAMRASWDNPMVSNYTLLAVILCVSTLIVGLRFLWVSGMLRLARAQDSHKRRRMTPERWRSAAVMTFGGAKGTITLSLMFTIPYTIADGEWFPMRDELIFIAGGVIIVTLLLSNFLLPVIAPNKAKDVPRETTEASIEVLRRTVEELAELTTDENRSAVMVVINSYTQRIGRLKNQLGTIDPSARIELQIDALNWEKEYVKRKLAEFRLDPTLSEREREVNVEACERLLDQIMDTLRHTNTKHDSSHVVWQVKGRAHLAQRRLVLLSRRAANTIRRSTPLVNENEIYASLRNLELGAFDHVIDRLYEEMSSNTYGTEYVSSLLMDYRRAEAALKSRPNMANSASLVTQIEDVKRESFGIELSVIQNMVEAGDITRAQARQLRKNVYVMSVAADSNF